MMCPTVIRQDGKPCMVLGTGGSNRIRTALLQVIAHCLFRNTSIHEAVHGSQGCITKEASSTWNV